MGALLADGEILLISDDSRMPKLLMVSPYYASHDGGVERVALQLAEGLPHQGWKVTWIASGGIDAMDAAQDGSGWAARPAPAFNAVEKRTGVPFPLWGLRALRQLWVESGLANVVMVHESLYVPSMFAVIVARLRRRPVLLVQHVGVVPYKQVVLRMILAAGNASWTRVIHALARKIVYISQGVMRHFEGEVPRTKSVLVPNGVDLTCFAPDGHHATNTHTDHVRPRILFVGRFVEKKGLDIIEALAKRHPELDFLLAGNGPIQPDEWALPNVRLLGFLDAPRLAQQYQMANLLLLPSHGEGFPLVVQEAMATGLAPLVSDEIAFALPGVVDHVYHAPVARDAHDLIDRWSALLDHALIAERDEQRARARAAFVRQCWSWEHCTATYDQLLRELRQ